MAVLLHQRVRFVAEAQAEQLAVFIGPAAQQLGGIAARHLQHRAHGRPFADLHVGHHFVTGQHALDQQFQLAARGLLAKQSRFDDLGVVEDQQVAGLQEIRQFTKDAVHRLRTTAIEQA